MNRATLSLILSASLALAACQGSPRASRPEPGERDLGKATQLVKEGDSLRRRKKHADAADRYKEALVAYEEFPSAWNNLGVCLTELNDYFAAQQAFIRAAELDPYDPRPYENVGLLYQNRLQDELASDYFLKSLDRAPNHLPSIRGAVKSASRLGRSDERTRDIIKRGLLLENDPEWLRIMQTQRIRVEQDLAQTGRSGAPSFSSGMGR